MSHIQNTWIAYAFDRKADVGSASAGLARVGAHYGRLFEGPLVSHSRGDEVLGMALWHPQYQRLRWPLWAERGRLAVAFTNPLTGWERLIGEVPPAAAAAELGEAVSSDPERLGSLNPPFVIAAHDEGAASLTVVNDAIATARLYELRTEAGFVWSNRLGALPLFAGIAPEADPEGWAIHAATGWFLGETTPIRGARKVAPGTAIVARAKGGAARVAVRQTNASRDLVAPRRASKRRSAGVAAEQVTGLARSIGSVWAVEPTVNLSGGRDSRISAAGFVAAGVKAEFRTMDIEPGEADLTRELIAALERPVTHVISAPERGEPRQGLRERIGAIHLVHDGIANPMSALQSGITLPQRNLPRPLVTGHGGELGHGFYYSRASLSELGKGGTAQLVNRLERAGRRRHDAASEEAYRRYVEEIERTLAVGRSYGVDGPNLLDYYYLAQRLPFRAGLGSRNDRYSACATPGFIRACFDLTPEDRLREKLHRRIVGLLVPGWKRVPFFQSGSSRTRRMNRDRIWAKPRHGSELGRLLEEDGAWSRWFDAERVQQMWERSLGGDGHPHYESVFMRIAWRACFEDHLRLLAHRATSQVGADQPSSAGR
jgi:hypothetical protein